MAGSISTPLPDNPRLNQFEYLTTVAEKRSFYGQVLLCFLHLRPGSYVKESNRLNVKIFSVEVDIADNTFYTPISCAKTKC